MVRYLPQNFIEELCNPVTADERKLFETEIKDVIFSWVPETERYGRTSLDEIINYRSDVVHRKVDELRSKINKTNKQIVNLEKKLKEDYQKEIEEKLKEKKKELESHNENKPQKVIKPEELLEEDQEFQSVHKELSSCKKRIDTLEDRKREYENLLSDLNNRIAAADRLIERIKMVKPYSDDVKLDLADELELLEIDFDKIVKVEINLNDIERRRKRFVEVKKSIDEFINGDSEESINRKLENLSTQKEKLENKLDEPDRLYQEYLTKREEWEKKKEKLIGSESTADSLKHLKKELEKIEDDYPDQLNTLDSERKSFVREIHEEFQELKTLYSNLYEPVSEFISDHEELLEDFNLSFDVSIESKEFKNKFLNKIHLGVIGSFYGESEANKYLSETHDSVDFNEADELISFLDTLNKDLHEHRETGEDLKIEKQLKGNETKLSLYDFLFGLEYLEPTYQLKLDGKELYQLSPGERGTLLLIFYLLIDRDKRPLIIDQPEENLDNETVYKVLVRCIREAKKRRQVIIVTHNPNLAVVCDAEQIIVADIDKKSENEVFYQTGSIENPKINERIINILEGTRPAFDNRDAKYIA
jgi:DNA repair exonuclease SbcCD ATPase subunit